ncbi:MAG: hypothetical protein A2283_12765 [Lentisphaerae bacterium RIFOXYA12_FULL_48_11]|nr:MAG: hypothetical protein A2283_12765 [Lentisphaerae bacterium RIFOXYA12_FULL_48_11]
MNANQDGLDETKPDKDSALPLNKKFGEPGFWNFFFSYLLIGSSAVIILIEIIESGVLNKLVYPLVLLIFAILNLARLQAAERKKAEQSSAGDSSTRGGSRTPEK